MRAQNILGKKMSDDAQVLNICPSLSSDFTCSASGHSWWHQAACKCWNFLFFFTAILFHFFLFFLMHELSLISQTDWALKIISSPDLILESWKHFTSKSFITFLSFFLQIYKRHIIDNEILYAVPNCPYAFFTCWIICSLGQRCSVLNQHLEKCTWSQICVQSK